MHGRSSGVDGGGGGGFRSQEIPAKLLIWSLDCLYRVEEYSPGPIS